MVKLKIVRSQDAFMDSYLNAQRENVFSDAEVLIYVFDIESRAVEQDLETYSQVIKALKEYSPIAHVFCLVHKMDLVKPELRETIYEERCQLIAARSEGLSLETFASSIWDQTLYKAWAGIVHKMIPNLIIIERFLEAFAKQLDAEEIVLFERSTFLTVTSVVTENGQDNGNVDRHERISNIMKSYKHTAARNTRTTAASAGFLLYKVQTPRFNCFLGRFTENTYIFVVVPPGEASFNCAVLNTMMARDAFSKKTGVEG
jgi:Ras-related GTP-binding protein A/B